MIPLAVDGMVASWYLALEGFLVSFLSAIPYVKDSKLPMLVEPPNAIDPSRANCLQAFYQSSWLEISPADARAAGRGVYDSVSLVTLPQLQST